ncbi:ComEC/Rec2 family competence protein [Borreliella valaisiana]|uniref:ComEC/Rec2 family competence protein n=1 Tax=Borreliella valaisiana TaxID=62088 RepID=UPI001AEFC6FD|nr:ComEC/Rec2 family competence protein [Borreliella valaisiana]WKC77216.1 ComEC/Rec2 family competence protein [Borreliella valaisiana]WVN14299.1 ComEC/Rec2 family competence protein [Borreliella valaisiana]
MILIFILISINLSIQYYLKLNLIYFNAILALFFIIKNNKHLAISFIFCTISLLSFQARLNFKTLKKNVYQIINIKNLKKDSKTIIEVIDNTANTHKFNFKNIKNIYKIGDIIKIENQKIKLIKRPFFAKLREKYTNTLNNFFAALNPSYSHFSKTIILNIKSEIIKYEKILFQNAGIAHILVVSGLHFYLISLITYYLLLIITNEKLKYLILSIILLNYLILTGFTPSTLRAFLMTESLIIYKLIYGKINLISCISISFIINAIALPETLNSIGFQLSYLATIGISASVYLKNRYDLNKLTSSMLTTFFIQIFTSPVIYVNNFDLTPISVLSNLIIIPLTLIFLAITILSLITYFLSLNLFFLFDLINAYIFQTIKITATFFSKFFIVKHHQIPIFLTLSILLITCIIYNNEAKKNSK